MFPDEGMEPPFKKFKVDNEIRNSQSIQIESEGLSNLPEELIVEIFTHLFSPEIKIMQIVCKKWEALSPLVIEKKYHQVFFDMTMWANVLNTRQPSNDDLESAFSLLPENIKEMLQATCPFSNDRWIQDSHLLIYLDSEINQKLIKIETLKKVVERQLSSLSSCFLQEMKIFDFYPDDKWLTLLFGNLDIKIPHPQWVLIHKEIVPTTLGLNAIEQQNLLNRIGKSCAINYKFPSFAAALSCMIAQMSLDKRRIPFVSHYTRCQETQNNQNIIIGEKTNTISISLFNGNENSFIGVAPAMTL